MFTKHFKKQYMLLAVIATIFAGCQAPTVDAGEDKTIKEGESVTLTCKATDKYNSTYSYKWLKGSDVASNTNSYTTPKDLSIGEHKYTCEATNQYLSGSDSVVVTVENSRGATNADGLLKRGQIESYTDFDDGYYQKGAERDFERDDNLQVVIDKTQGLMWQDDDSNNHIDYKELQAKINADMNRSADTYIPLEVIRRGYCKYVDIRGYSNWRLPSKDELLSLLNYKTYPMAQGEFENINLSKVYMTTYEESYNSGILGISLQNGSYSFSQTGHTPICVRSIDSNKTVLPNIHNFERDDNLNVVIDKDINLMWQDDNASVDIEKDWEDAIKYCEDLELAGFNDWRLPNVNELATLYDKTGYEGKPELNDIFQYKIWTNYFIGNYALSNYWSSTTSPEDNNKALIFTSNESGVKSDLNHIKCVRDAQ